MSSPPYDPVALVTEDEARLHLRIDSTGESPPDVVDQTVSMKILQASEIVVDYIKYYDHPWDETTAPQLIKAAVLIVLGVLYDSPDKDPLSDGVKSILHRYRDPALA
jgi:hypothetical protein